MPKFVLLLHDQPKSFATMSPAEMQAVVQRYMAWGQSLRDRDLLVEGTKLTSDPGRVMRRTKGEVLVSDGPYLESKEVMGGLFVIKAADYDEAVRLAHDCPHLDYSGAIEVRQVDGR
ncbi:MAG: YciI family protein [Vicinamibacterales bacterium]